MSKITKPSIPALGKDVQPSVKRAFDAIKNYLNGLPDAVAAQVRSSTGGGGQTIINVGGTEDPTIPPAPFTLSVHGGLGICILEWGGTSSYVGHAYTEIHRLGPLTEAQLAEGHTFENHGDETHPCSHNINDATYVGSTNAEVYTDYVNATSLGQSYHYRVRFVSVSGDPGPWSNWAWDTTADDPAYLLDQLAGEIRETELFTDLNARLDNLDDQFVIKLNNDGYMSGFGLASEPVDGVPFSQFLILADRFAVINPNVGKMSVGITRTGSVATGTTSEAHNLNDDDYIVISGAEQSEYNGTQKVTVTGPLTFTFPVSGSPASPATGTITFGRGMIPFIVQDNRVFIREALIADATITAAMIGDAVITGAHIANGTIVSANIGDAQITDAKIGGTIKSGVLTALGTPVWEFNRAGALTIRDVDGSIILTSGIGVNYGTVYDGPPADATNNTFFSQGTVPVGATDGDVWYCTANISTYTANTLYIRISGVWQAASNNLATGVNLMPPHYSTFGESAPPLFAAAHSSISMLAGGPFGHYLLNQATNIDAWMFLGESETDYNIPLIPGKKWRVSWFEICDTNLATSKDVYLRTNDGDTYHGINYTESSTTVTRRYKDFDLTASAATKAVLRFDVNVNGRIVGYDGVMVEMIDDTSVSRLSPYAAPGFMLGGGAPISGTTISTYIKALAVDTLYIAGNAVTIPVGAWTSSGISVGAGTPTTVQTVNLGSCSAGRSNLISVSWTALGTVNPWLQIVRVNNTTSAQTVIYGPVQHKMLESDFAQLFNISAIDTIPEDADYSYRFQMQTPSSTLTVTNRNMVCLGCKR